MDNKRRLLRGWLLAFVALLLIGSALISPLPVRAESAPPGDDGTVVWNEDYTLGEGEEVAGDLVVFNGDAILEVDSRVQGSAVVWNGDAEVKGSVQGDLVVTSGEIRLAETAHVYGNVVCSWNCELQQAEGATIEGQVIEGLPFRGFRIERLDELPEAPTPSPPPFYVSGARKALEWMLKIIRGLVTVLVIAVIGGLVALIWPREMERVGRTVFDDPLPSAGIGLLTVIAAVTLIITLAITICLSPAAVLLALALGVAGLFGWVAIGAEIGTRLLQSLRSSTGDLSPMWAAGLGTLLITLISLGLSAAFCLAPFGWLLSLTLSLLGLGAVVLTRFGTRRYIPGQPGQRPPASTPPPEPPPPPAELTTVEPVEPAAEPSEGEADEEKSA